MDLKSMLVALAVLVVLVLVYSLIEPYLVRVNDVTISDSRVPQKFVGRRIAYLSDIHCGPFLSVERVRQVVDLTNAQKPDIILLGGDYVLGGKGLIRPCVGELAHLQAPLGVYAVLGNHDNWAGHDESVKALEDSGIKVLDNSGVWVAQDDGRIRLAGVGDLWTESSDLKPALGEATAKDYILLLSHNPQYEERADVSGISLVLSGHTHGGQILPVRLLAPYLPSMLHQRYVAGLYEKGGTRIFVTNGIGMTFLPVRFMSRPEIVIVTLRK